MVAEYQCCAVEVSGLGQLYDQRRVTVPDIALEPSTSLDELSATTSGPHTVG